MHLQCQEGLKFAKLKIENKTRKRSVEHITYAHLF